jgi:carboxypeptidase family protein
MRRILAFALALSMSLSATPIFAAPRTLRAAQGQGASLAGTATSNAGQPLANYAVQVRNLDTGQLAGTTTSGVTGGFNFAGLEAGNYAVEVVNAAGQVIGSSASIAVAAGATVVGVAVGVPAAALGAAAGGAAAAGAATGVSTAVIVTTVAVAGGVLGAVVVAKRNASPSR